MAGVLVLSAATVMTGPAIAVPPAAEGGGRVVAWGGGPGTEVPPGLDHVVAVAAGRSASLALRTDGTVIGWGNAPIASVPTKLRDVIAIAAGRTHALALREDGTVLAWGANDLGQTDVPADLGDDVTAIAVGEDHNLALREDGTVLAWGANDLGQTDVPKDLHDPGNRVTAVAAGAGHSLALDSQGLVRTWGGPTYATVVPTAPLAPTDRAGELVSMAADLPALLSLTPFTALAASGGNSLALREDGTVLQWGPRTRIRPGALAVTTIATGNSHSLALRGDGTVVGWGGNNWFGQNDPPIGLTGVTAIAAGGSDSSAGAQSLAVTNSPLPTVPFPRLPLS